MLQGTGPTDPYGNGLTRTAHSDGSLTLHLVDGTDRAYHRDLSGRTTYDEYRARLEVDPHHCTIEEREEYAPHIEAGHLVFAGVDYERIVRAAEKEAEVILWDSVTSHGGDERRVAWSRARRGEEARA